MDEDEMFCMAQQKGGYRLNINFLDWILHTLIGYSAQYNALKHCNTLQSKHVQIWVY